MTVAQEVRRDAALRGRIDPAPTVEPGMTWSTLTRRTPLRPVSRKKARQRAAWAKTSRRVLAERPNCEGARLLITALREFELTDDEYAALRRAFLRCPFSSQEVHHVVQRSLGGTDDDSNLLALCRNDHAWAHEHIELATKVGLLRPSWDAS